MFSFSGRVRYSECDETGRLSLVSMMDYLQDCSTFQSLGLGMGIDGLASRGLAWVLATWSIEVDRLPAFGEEVTASTWCYEMTRAHALRSFGLSDVEGAPLVRADSQWFVYDFTAGRATRVPEDQRAYLSDEPRLEVAPLPRRIRPARPAERAPERPVTRRDLDTNRHVNNAQYVGLALDALEALGHEAPVGALQVQYRSMARLDDVVVPLVSPCERGWDVDLTDGFGTTYAVVRLQEREG
ncbi:acyl-[acyl-carrier-protein] thioesterase [Olsenella profusa]|uniref:Acyl-[acyl-carrier-protein] thioesterase n=1 Tax=Olsenella profusa TaxID=138595 RepID=A0ABS2EZQ6_9ACTN|nr:acyl-ACP thioesterase domain-containing protein [Olsenella profusa]MBM6774047.1 acyl-[acyl-carrier-protein] thioesterase [Olsenella profusa]